MLESGEYLAALTRRRARPSGGGPGHGGTHGDRHHGRTLITPELPGGTNLPVQEPRRGAVESRLGGRYYFVIVVVYLMAPAPLPPVGKYPPRFRRTFRDPQT
jgi:hypothetical protein